jgi:hypothetical protein
MGERDVNERVEVFSDVREGEPAHLDEAEESLGAKQTLVQVRIAHVPVGGDQARNRVEKLRGFAGIGHRLERKVAHFDPCRSESLHAFFGWLLDVADVACYFCWGGRGGFGTMRGG